MIYIIGKDNYKRGILIMGNLYEAIKDYIETWDKCNKCGEPTFDFQLEEFNGICEECYYEDK